jgi:acyl dehydratase
MPAAGEVKRIGASRTSLEEVGVELFTIGANLVGRDLPCADFSWDTRDVILYALGVGATPPEELSYLDEQQGPLVLPTFALIPNWWAVRGLGDVIDRAGCPMVHASQALAVHRTLPSTGRVTARAFISAVWDKGTNTLIEVTCAGDDAAGPLFEARSGTMILGLGGWGGERGPSAAGDTMPNREPDVVLTEHVRPEQSAIYRLSGDLNRIHIDASAAQAAGFADVFLHGLCTLGFATRSVLKVAAPTEKMSHVEVRFASPVYLDQPLETRLWNTDRGQWRFVTLQQGRTVLGGGRATVGRT